MEYREVAHCPLEPSVPRFMDFLVEMWGVPMGVMAVAKRQGKGWGVGADSGLLEAVRLLVDAGCRVDSAVLVTAAKRGDLPLVRLLHERGNIGVGNVVRAAVAGGSPEILGYIQASNERLEVGPHTLVYIAAAQQGDLATLEALQRMGCACGTLRDAVAEGIPLCVLQWMAGHGVRAGNACQRVTCDAYLYGLVHARTREPKQAAYHELFCNICDTGPWLCMRTCGGVPSVWSRKARLVGTAGQPA